VGSRSGSRCPSSPRSAAACRGGDLLLTQPVELGRVADADGGRLGGQLQVLPERGGQLRQLAVELRQARASGVVEAGAGQDAVEVVALDQPHRLGVEPGVVPRGVDGVDAGEQDRVQAQRVRVRGLQGRELPLDLAETGRGHRRGQVAEHRPGPAQQGTGALQGLDRVPERRRPGRAGDRVELGALLGHPGEHRLATVLQRDLGERREPVRQRRVGQQRVGRRRVGGGGGGVGAHRAPSSATPDAPERPRCRDPPRACEWQGPAGPSGHRLAVRR
jgi:hypothetical protein